MKIHFIFDRLKHGTSIWKQGYNRGSCLLAASALRKLSCQTGLSTCQISKPGLLGQCPNTTSMRNAKRRLQNFVRSWDLLQCHLAPRIPPSGYVNTLSHCDCNMFFQGMIYRYQNFNQRRKGILGSLGNIIEQFQFQDILI